MSDKSIDCAEVPKRTSVGFKVILLYVADWVCMRIAVFLMFVLIVVSRIIELIQRRKCDKEIVFVYANDLLGDTFVKLPFFFSLRNEFPREKCHLVVVLAPSVAEIIGKLALFDEIVEEAPLHWRHPLFWLVGRNGIAASLRWAFSHKVKTMIVCHRSRSLGCDFALRLCDPSISVAYVADLRRPMLPMTAKYQARVYDGRYTYLLMPEDGRHQMIDMDRLLSLSTGRHIESRRLGRNDLAPIFDFSLVKPGQEYIVIVPGAGVEYRRWPIGRFVEVIRILHGTVVVVGNAEESCLAAEIASNVDCNVINLCGKTSLSQLGGVLLHARLVISNETGTANYSAVIGTKTICILGGGDFGAFFPNRYCPNVVCLFHKEPCFNCGWKCCKKAMLGFTTAPCIAAVSVDDVLTVVNKMIV